MIPLHKVLMHEDAWRSVASVLDSGWIGQGQEVGWFEEEFAQALKLPHRPLMTNSCTAALDLALAILEVGPGDEVISTPMTCVATNMIIHNRGAKIVWADVNPITGLIDPDDVAERITPKTAAIMAVNWGGRSCDYVRLRALRIPIVEDAAHCLLPFPITSHGDYVCWSLQAIKFLTSGDGGVLLCPAVIAEFAKRMRWFGLDRDLPATAQDITHSGFKYAPNDIAGAMARANLHLGIDAVHAHQHNARQLHERITAEAPNVLLPSYDERGCYWLFTLLLPNVDEFIAYASGHGVHAGRVHVRNDHLTVFNPHRSSYPLPGVDCFNDHQVNVPIGWWLTESDLETVADCIISFAKRSWRG